MNTPKNQSMQWIELSSSALHHNIQMIKQFLPQKELPIAGLLKANAYGHGLIEMAELFSRHNVSRFLVHHLYEAINLRQKGFKERIILLGPIYPTSIEEALSNQIELTIYTQEMLQDLYELCLSKPHLPCPKIHIKIETGTHRQGILEKDLPPFIASLKSFPSLQIMGVSSHFANIEDTSDKSYCQYQLQRFNEALKVLEQSGVFWKERHFACSAAVFLYPETLFDFVRPGIAIFGYLSSPEMAYGLKLDTPLKPLLSWKTKIAQIKNIPKNSYVGYGLSYKTRRETILGVIPVGYSDGLDRKLSNKGYCLIKGQRAPFIGRICMNLTMIDLTDISSPSLNDEVVLIGHQGSEFICADRLAEMTDTISYEVLARLNPLIPKEITS